jgi:serine/threonine protein phosphatase PrpC
LISATEIFCLNELGKRTNNEDFVSPRKGTATIADKLFVVCDGVGGEKKGEVASGIVCLAIQEYIKKQASINGRERGLVQNAIHHANEKLAAYVSTDPDAKRMSTTLALVLLGDTAITAAWCGDTRIHHIRAGNVLWKSKDHSLVGELVSQGELTEEEARRHPQRNVITRSLNALNFNNAVDYHEIKNVESGDYLLLCTDGLLERINERLIGEILLDNEQKDKAKSFLLVCDGATRDNFSMYLLRCELTSQTKRKRPIAFIVLLLAVSLILLCLAIFFFTKS